MAGKLKTEELEHNGAMPLYDYFLGLLGKFGLFFFPPALTATLHFAWKPSILQILDFF